MRLTTLRRIAITGLVACALGGAWFALSPGQQAESTITTRPIRVGRDGSVASDACRTCHTAEHAAWRASYHRTMTTVASPVAARFVRDGVPTPSTWGPMSLVAQDAALWASLPDPDRPPPAQPSLITPRVALITGSHHQQVFWYETGRTRVLGAFPLTYLIGERRWIPRSAAFLQPPAPVLQSGTGHWNQVCISCHTTGGEARVPDMYARTDPAAMSADSRVREFGVACESCHGPGGGHVRSPKRLASVGGAVSAGGGIVNPARLDPARASEVCGQCHSVWEWPDKAAERDENAHGSRFRPGDVLARSRFVVQPTRNLDSPRVRALLADDPDFVRDAFWPDGTIALAGREYNGLIDSPCFTRAATADRTLTCLSCHALHQGKQDQRPAEAWADDQLQPRANGDQACLHCHEPIRARVTEHTHHAAGSSGSRCYNCHMPYTTYGLLKTVRAHRITSPDARVSRETGRPDACSLCHLDKPLAWTAGRLERWYGLPQPSLDEEARSTPAAVVWALTGDAQQRAVMADAFGRAEARAVSSEHWVGPVLATLLDDPYPAVRLIADRSLRVFSLPGTAHYDFLAPRAARMQASQQALAEWRTRAGAPRAPVVSDVALRVLTARRNDRRVALRE